MQDLNDLLQGFFSILPAGSGGMTMAVLDSYEAGR